METVGAAEQFATPACQAALLALAANDAAGKDAAGSDVANDVLIADLTALGKLRCKPAIPALVKRLEHSDALVRQTALETLVAIGGGQASGEVIGMLDDKSAPVRRTAIQALGSLHARDAVPRLLALYRKGDSRFEISQALAEIPDLSAVDIYMDGLASKNTKLRDLSARAIAKVGIEALPLVEARLNGKTPPEVVMTLQQIFSERQPITAWSLLGPLPNPTQEPFSVTKVDLNAQFKDSRGQMTRWKPAKLSKNPPGHVNLASQMNGVSSDATAYALAEIHAPAASEVDFVAGSDDSLTLWLNGQQIFEALGSRGYKADDFHIHAKLQAGKNVLLAKIGQFSGGWEFSVGYLVPRKGRCSRSSPNKSSPPRTPPTR